MPSAGFEAKIPAGELSKIYALNCAASETGSGNNVLLQNFLAFGIFPSHIVVKFVCVWRDIPHWAKAS